MKKGFTLVELLAVIVILAVIAVIAVPQVLKIISQSRIDAYNRQQELIIDAAKLYMAKTSKTVTTIKELQNNHYLQSNIIDQRSGKSVSTNTWIFATESTKPQYNFGYIQDGLLVNYDGIYNGGIGIHNDNSSTNKNIWKDLSGNGNDGVLTGFDYTTDSGWSSDHLKLDGIDDWGSIAKAYYDYMTVEAVYSIPTTFSGERTVVANFESGGIGIQPVNNYIKGTTFVAGSYWNLYGESIVLNKKYKTTILYDGNQVKIYDNDVLSNISIKGVIGIPQANTIFAIGTNPGGNSAYSPYFNGNIYSIRIYNKALTEEEVKNNYEIDKKRFEM